MAEEKKEPRIALIHDHLAQDGGAEKVLKVFSDMYPKAPIFTLLYEPNNAAKYFKNRTIQTSIIQRIPGGVKHYKWFMPFMPMAVEFFNLSTFDVVISDTSSFAKGVITSVKTPHICYCHTPTRYLWSDTHQYINELKYNKWFKKIISLVLNRIRIWDRLAADRVDYFIANSENIRRKIKKYYRREATVIYAPADLDKFRLASNRGNYFLTGGRLVAYKKFDLTIKVFNRLGWPLKIFGAGPEIGALKKMARPNIEFLGRISDQALSSLYAEAKAFIFPQEEDLGITALESMAAGRPVIAFASGGALETVIPGKTGILFGAQTIDALSSAVKNFKESDFNPEEIREYVSRFDAKIFEQKIKIFIEEAKSKYYGAKTNQAQIKPLSVG